MNIINFQRKKMIQMDNLINKIMNNIFKYFIETCRRNDCNE